MSTVIIRPSQQSSYDCSNSYHTTVAIVIIRLSHQQFTYCSNDGSGMPTHAAGRTSRQRFPSPRPHNQACILYFLGE
ncbi:MAG: hypothetical protein K2N13_07990 [Paraprevotella sp.]|nr:hypothetical protein [Paraprevotella sp.]